MTLLDDLKGSLTGDGFDLGATVGRTRSAFGAISVTPGALDLGPLKSAAGAIGGVDLGGIVTAVAAVASQVQTLVGGRPDAGALVAPLTQSLVALERLVQFDLASLVGSLRGPPGDDRFAAAVSALASIGTGGALDALGAVFPAFRPGDVLGAGAEVVGAVLSLLRTIQNLVRIASDTAAAGALGRGLDGLLEAADLSLRAPAVVAAAAGLAPLAPQMAGVDPNDAAAVAPILAAVDAATMAVALAVGDLGRWLDVAVSAVERADLPAVAARIDAAAAALRTVDLAPVAELARSVRQWLAPLVAAPSGTGPPDVDAFIGQLRSQLTAVTARIDTLDLGAAATVLRPALDAALAPIKAVEAAAHDVVIAVQTALEGVRAAVAAIDLRPVTDALRQVVTPVANALGALEAGVTAAGATLHQVAIDVADAVSVAQAAVGGAVTAVHDAFARVKSALDAVDLAAVQAAIEGQVQSMADALASAPIGPVFATATTAIDAVGDVVKRVPLDLLPADAKNELHSKVAPIKAIDFEAQVATPLKHELDEIVAQLDAAVLTALRAAYAKVTEFLASIDPTPAIDALQRQAFDPLLERLRRVDPAQLLAPVIRAVDDAKRALAGFDPAAALAPLDEAVDTVKQAVQAFDPATLTEPIASRLDALRTGMVVTSLRLLVDRLTAEVDRLVDAATAPLAAIDAAALTRFVDAVLAALEDVAGAATPSARTVSAFVRFATGATEAAGSVIDAVDWVAGRADPVREVADRLATAADALDAAAGEIAALDLSAAIAALGPPYQALTAAVAALPPGSALRVGVEPTLARVDPAHLLAAADLKSRAADAIHGAAGVARALASAGHSELQAVAHALQDALLPVREVTAHVRALLGRFGASPLDDPVTAVHSLLAALRASDVFSPLVTAVAALLARVPAGLRAGLVAPIKEVAAEIERLLGALDIRFVNGELTAIQRAVVAQIDTIKPSTAFADVLGPAQAALDALAALNVLEPVDAAVQAVASAMSTLESLAPATLLAPAVDLHHDIVAAAGVLDVDRLAGPVIGALKAIEAELDDGLDQADAALKRLQAALP